MTRVPLYPSQQGTTGFFQALRRENRKWWRVGRWYKQAVLWSILLGILTFLFFSLLAPVSGLINILNEIYAILVDRSVVNVLQTLRGNSGVEQVQFSNAVLVLPPMFILGYFLIGEAIIVTCAGQHFEELRSGALSWSLTRPIKRGAIVAAKALGDNLGIWLLALGIPFAVVYVITLVSAREQSVALNSYLMGFFLLMIGLAFWHSLVTVLSFGLRSRLVATVIPVLLLLLGNIISRNLDTLLGTGDFFYNISPWSSRNLMQAALSGSLSVSNSSQMILIISTIGWTLFLYALTWLRLRRMDL